jgi:hypothetical protein
MWEWFSSVVFNPFTRKIYLRKMKATTFGRWADAVEELDKIERKGEYIVDGCDGELVDELTVHLAHVRTLCERTARSPQEEISRASLEKLVECVKTSCVSDLGGINNEELYSFNHSGTSEIVHDFMHQVILAIRFLYKGSEDHATELDDMHSSSTQSRGVDKPSAGGEGGEGGVSSFKRLFRSHDNLAQLGKLSSGSAASSALSAVPSPCHPSSWARPKVRGRLDSEDIVGGAASRTAAPSPLSSSSLSPSPSPMASPPRNGKVGSSTASSSASSSASPPLSPASHTPIVPPFSPAIAPPFLPAIAPPFSPARLQRLREELSHSFGTTALCLSGGAGNGYYHLGVVRALHRRGLLPTIVSGASAGSLIGAMVCSHTDEELHATLLNPEVERLFTACEEPWYTKLGRLVTKGHVFDMPAWREKLSPLTCGELTFKEAFERTGRVLAISVYNGDKHSRLLSHISSPHVLISSAVLASSALPLLLPPMELLIKRPDGRIERDHSMGRFTLNPHTLTPSLLSLLPPSLPLPPPPRSLLPGSGTTVPSCRTYQRRHCSRLSECASPS